MDAAGNNNRPSYFIERILRIFPKLKISMEEEEQKTGYTKEEALDQMILCLQDLDLTENEDSDKMKWMQTLYYFWKCNKNGEICWMCIFTFYAIWT